MKTLIFDTETTGLPYHPEAKGHLQPRIIEWGGALVDQSGTVLATHETLVNPGVPLPPRITEVTGLKDEDLVDQPRFPTLAAAVRPMFESADVLLAHNLPFDSALMAFDLARNKLAADWPWPGVMICTVQEHAEEWGRRPKLVELYHHYFGEALSQKHRALDDVMALVAVAQAAGALL